MASCADMGKLCSDSKVMTMIMSDVTYDRHIPAPASLFAVINYSSMYLLILSVLQCAADESNTRVVQQFSLSCISCTVSPFVPVVVLSTDKQELHMLYVVTLPNDVQLMFKDGFPWNWKEIVHVAADELVAH